MPIQLRTFLEARTKEELTEELQVFFQTHQQEAFQYEELPRHRLADFSTVLGRLIEKGLVEARQIIPSTYTLPVWYYAWKGKNNA